ncbi:PhzF family phenazine biosynthesis protein [Arthrospira platensis]|jgi:trans-2,3-dihydro-3-hydroxyanthranilate isomerase|uniref:PhzF family phenazine biosynthesis protein n=1 Tax=Limnospira platensis NIES-46 TaxID=1236695 RepID=A0A5M3TEB2_LIMPL|nr:PhzF family phenazine biosynthesis protein [Arthrospira platensis]AMW28763.1 phenazine biosynthesis protein [Arthrospira platensis YZ]KDR56249.1 phenazine biosynthesis protein [Arthrospira platensis str. Paraca]MBD2671215.1 PhzF family phenazine biosynthesis protein [Arthrospira platensis FACHB-439]MBD2712604.1 PhzF family phenazine biosynthesis protein [Arthrospira platensis FACHB-835]MDF2210374.1 PhzF family phenazine biosynthesis protein [Arthrospira platensis NCB002]MDT9185245.1 PhzF f
MDFYIVDVFAEAKYAGNQLAVFFGEGVSSLSDEEMLEIAQEMNYSETTFIRSVGMVDGGYDVRIFTPSKELPFAGHPTLGTAYIIQRELIKKPVDQVVLNLGVGQIPVTWSNGNTDQELLWMRPNNPVFYNCFNAADIAPVLGLEIADFDDNFPIQEVSTGIPFLIVPLKNKRALKQAKVNLEHYFEFIKNINTKEIFVFCPEPYDMENNISARMFAPALGITEDPATGSANSCLAGYLVHNSYYNRDNISVRVEQGYEINRPSLLFLKGEKKVGDEIEVMVGGKVVAIAKGEWLN